MGIGRYFDFAKEIIQWVADWVSLAIEYWREIVAVVVIMWVSWKALDFLIAWTSYRSHTYNNVKVNIMDPKSPYKLVRILSKRWPKLYINKKVKVDLIATVTHKERVYYPRKMQSVYLIYTDKGVFRNQDSWAYLSFNSSDTYSRIITGSTYKFTIYGYRNRWNSEYPNILKTELC